MVVVMKNPRIKREAVTARTRYQVQVIGTVIDAGRAAWQGLCYQRHRAFRVIRSMSGIYRQLSLS